MPRTPPSSRLGSSLRLARERAGRTQAQLAELAGIADATISRLERGRLNPSAELLSKLAGALGVSVDDLMKRAVIKAPTLRPSVARLVAAVESLDDGQIDDVTKAVRLLLEAGKRASTGR